MAATAAAAAAAMAVFPFKPSLPAIKPRIYLSTPPISLNPLRCPSSPLLRWNQQRFLRCSAVQDIAVEEETKESEERSSEYPAASAAADNDDAEQRRKLYVANMPWSYSAPDIEKLFGECGDVKKIEIIKQKNGKSRGFAFITMGSAEEAQAAIQKFDSVELLDRIITVEFSKSFRKPSPPSPPGAIVVETPHTIYVANLAWKARSVDLRNFFSSKFKPHSARVVFDGQKSAGYGFVSFDTLEEAEASIAELDGKELLGRPLRLRISQKKNDESLSEQEKADSTEGQAE